jgi:glycosyltransferase involved in cell wall biosynthesis
MPGPIISIVISSFNYGRYLRECIDSALNQTHPRVQVVVIDDGSTDESSAIIASYGDLIESVLQPNRGQGAVWNVSAPRVSGSWVIFLDSDDRLSFRAAERVAAASIAHPGSSKMHWPMRLIGADGGSLGIEIPGQSLPSGDRLAELKAFGFDRGPNMATSGNAWLAEFTRRVLPMPEAEFKISADTWLLGLSPLFGQTIALGEVLSEYRSHSVNNGSRGTDCGRANAILARSVLVFSKVADELTARGFQADPAHWAEVNPTLLEQREILARCDDDSCHHGPPILTA